MNDRPKPVRPENHLFQIKEVESCATSVLIQSTPGLNNMSATPREGMQNTIAEVNTEEFERTPKGKSESRPCTPIKTSSREKNDPTDV